MCTSTGLSLRSVKFIVRFSPIASVPKSSWPLDISGRWCTTCTHNQWLVHLSNQDCYTEHYTIHTICSRLLPGTTIAIRWMSQWLMSIADYGYLTHSRVALQIKNQLVTGHLLLLVHSTGVKHVANFAVLVDNYMDFPVICGTTQWLLVFRHFFLTLEFHTP